MPTPYSNDSGSPFQSGIFKMLTSHTFNPSVNGSAFAEWTGYEPWGGGPFPTKAADATAWTLRTDSFQPIPATADAFVNYVMTLDIHVTGGYGDIASSDLLIYELWGEVTYADASVHKFYPTQWQRVYGGYVSDSTVLLNPGNAFDGNNTTYADLNVLAANIWQQFSLTFQLTGFNSPNPIAPVYAVYPYPIASVTLPCWPCNPI